MSGGEKLESLGRVNFFSPVCEEETVNLSEKWKKWWNESLSGINQCCAGEKLDCFCCGKLSLRECF